MNLARPRDSSDSPAAVAQAASAQAEAGERVAIARVAYHPETAVIAAPPGADEFDQLEPWPISLDEALQMALASSPLIRDAGGRVLAMPDAVRATSDPDLVGSDPLSGPQAALSAFDTQLEAGLTWNGGGRSVNSAFSSNAFGVFSQPTTIAKLGVGRTLATGTEVILGGVGGYDELLADGLYAAWAAQLRHPLVRGAGREVNQIAGPRATAGNYRGLRIAQVVERTSRLELERAARDLAREVVRTYWELQFAHENLAARLAAREHARQSWHRERRLATEGDTTFDAAALAQQQFYSAEAAVRNAITGTGSETGVYAVETQLRRLLGLPASDGRLLRPSTPPLSAEIRFDWKTALHHAQTHRVEIRRQTEQIHRRSLELRAARNLSRAQVDLVGQFRRLADDPGSSSPLFGEALQGWQLGLEVQRPVANRRERAAVQHAELRLRREHLVLHEQEREVAAQLRLAFTELDRTSGVVQALAASREAARFHLQAEMKRHAAGDTHIERVLEAQVRAAEADTAFRRAEVEYSQALVELDYARGALLASLGIGVTP